MAGILSAFTGALTASTKVAEFVIVPLDNDARIDNSLGGAKVLQYWPASISDGKSANWQSRDVMGSPLPMYQWVNGSERSISFTANFSRDMSGEIGKNKDLEEDKFNVDVDAAIAWLRMLSMNDYAQVGNVPNAAVPPPVLWICGLGTSPKSGMRFGYNSKAKSDILKTPLSKTGASGVYCLMTECSADRSNWFQDGTTRYAEVSLSFVETMQIGRGIYQYGRSDFLSEALKYNRRPS